MNRRTAAHFAISNLLERAATFGLAAMVTLSVLAGMDGVADRQYEAAYIAQSSAGAVQVARVPADSADSAQSSIPHESV
jgi:hypothetical protein